MIAELSCASVSVTMIVLFPPLTTPIGACNVCSAGPGGTTTVTGIGVFVGVGVHVGGSVGGFCVLSIGGSRVGVCVGGTTIVGSTGTPGRQALIRVKARKQSK